MSDASWLTVTTRPAPALVDGRACRTRPAFFAEVARVLGFPEYFGHNWDALLDSLRDLGPTTLVVARAEELLADEPDEADTDIAILLRVLATASTGGVTVTLCTDPAHETALRERIERARRP